VLEHLKCSRLAVGLADELQRSRIRSGLLPICSYCKRIRDDRNYWREVESYVRLHSQVEFSHGICPRCITEHFPEVPQS